jgi:hypothetical protein
MCRWVAYAGPQVQQSTEATATLLFGKTGLSCTTARLGIGMTAEKMWKI